MRSKPKGFWNHKNRAVWICIIIVIAVLSAGRAKGEIAMNYDREYSRYLTGENRNYDQDLIQALKEDKMHRCKEDVIELIDEVLEFKDQLKRCFCKGKDGEEYECDNCKTKRVLKLARACVVQGADELDLLKVRFIGVQEAIEDKLKAILRPDESGGN